MRLDRADLRCRTIAHRADAGACLRFAAAELRRYLLAMTGGGTDDDASLPVRASASFGGATLRLADGPEIAAPEGNDAYRIAAGERGVTVVGSSERAALHGVYRLLEDLGCAWSPHGSEYESVPVLSGDGVSIRECNEQPPWRVRAYATDIHTYHYREPDLLRTRLPADFAFTDWMGKSGANGFLFIRHPFDTQLSLPELVPEFAKRGIEPEYGGHVLPLLLPRESFAAHPEWFPLDGHGRRTDMGNLCSNNAEALRVVAAAAVEYVARHPELAVLHIWGADLWDGGWCRCCSCANDTVQDQNLRVCNAVAEALERAGIAIDVCYLAYHDTIEPDLRLVPRANVIAEFAPRERCYGHALDDPACAINPRYREAFERHVERFDGRVRLFEYYGDSILFCGIAVPLVRVIADDLAYYHRAGAREMTFLQFGAHSLWAHALNFERYAGIVARSSAPAPRSFGYPPDYWQEIEGALAGVVTFGDVRRPPRRRADEIRPGLEAALRVLRGWLPRLRSDPLQQRPLLEYTCAVLEGVALQLAGTATAHDEAEARYRHALDILEGVDDHFVGLWGRKNLPVIHSFHSAASRRS